MNFTKTNLFSELLDKDFEKKLELLEININDVQVEVENNIIEAAGNSISPDSDDGQQISKLAEFFRNFGYRILNLFELRISISFAGYVLFNFQFPKVDSKTKTFKLSK